MSIKVLFFGILSEVIKKDNISIPVIKDTDELNNYLQINYPEIKTHTYRIALNKEMLTENTKLKDGDEVALLPPFAGG
jgi:molybdopterin synthase sulfur carrier subunit